jgi:predicted amidophosphoribosyltransferase
MFFGSTCSGCDRPGPVICAACAAQLRRPAPFPPPPGLTTCVALLVYTSVARHLVVDVKYRNARLLVARLAAGLAAVVAAPPGPDGASAPRVDVITWAPTSGTRRRLRGYDQAELLAAAVARNLGLPCRPLLTRITGPPQTGRARDERHAGPGFRAAPCREWRVLVVDDVVTTGATLTSAATALRASGAVDVHGAVAARTPLASEGHPTQREFTMSAQRTLKTQDREVLHRRCVHTSSGHSPNQDRR